MALRTETYCSLRQEDMSVVYDIGCKDGIRTSHVEEGQHDTTNLSRGDLADIGRDGTLHDARRKPYDDLIQAENGYELFETGKRDRMAYLASEPLFPVLGDYFNDDADHGEEDDGVQTDSTTESVGPGGEGEWKRVSLLWLRAGTGVMPSSFKT